MKVPDSFYESLLRGCGLPNTEENLRVCRVWQLAEGGQADWNPFNTTQPENGATNYNSVGVKNYPDEATGVRATCETLKNGYYPTILDRFRRGVNGYAVCVAIEQSPWGTHFVHQDYARAYGTMPLWFVRVLRVESPMMNGPDVLALQKVFARYHKNTVCDGKYGPATGKLVENFKRVHGLQPDEVFGVAAAYKLAATT